MILSFLIFSALTMTSCSWIMYECERETQNRPDFSWEPYDEEDRKN